MSEALPNLVLARHYVDLGQAERALVTLERAEGALEHLEYWLVRAQANFDLARYEEARRAAQEGLALESESVPLLFLLGSAEAELGDLAAAERALLQALELQPEEPKVLCRYALLVAQGGQLGKAEKLVGAAAQLNAEDEYVHYTRTVLAYLKGSDRAALERSRDYLGKHPESSVGHYLHGVSLAASHRSAQAGRVFQQVARRDPGEHAFAQAAREGRLASHWLLSPLRPFERFGTAGTWIGAMVLIFGARGLGFPQLSTYLAFAYLALVVYSWVAPFLLRRWLRRRF